MQEGVITKWQDDRGFGFIKTRDGAELFFHISSWQGTGHPAEDMWVRFVSSTDAKGRTEAQQVEPLSDSVAPERALSGRVLPGSKAWRERQGDAEDGLDDQGPSVSDWGFRILVFLAAFAAAFFLWDRVQNGWVSATGGSGSHIQQGTAFREQGPERAMPSRNYPQEVYQTLRLIYQGGPFPHRQDGSVFQNRERQLPPMPKGYYREYTVATPGARDRGARRIVTGGDPPTEYYYTDNHYRSFKRMELDRD